MLSAMVTKYGGVNHRCLIRFSVGRECGECGYGRHQAVMVNK